MNSVLSRNLSITIQPKLKKVTKSITDPECGILNRPGKPNGFHYLDHQTCDSKNGMITDVFVTSHVSKKDCTPHTERIEYQIEKFGFDTEAVCADKAYDSGEIHNAMLKKGIKTLIPQRSLLNLVQISKQILIKLILLSMKKKTHIIVLTGKNSILALSKKAKALRYTNHENILGFM